MNQSELTKEVIDTLKRAGYELIKTPLSVASVEFNFTAALRGPRSRGLDLVLVLDTSIGSYNETDGNKARDKIHAFARALDVLDSKIAITTICSGAPLPSKIIESISDVSRILNVVASDEKIDQEYVENQIRVLLPLSIDINNDAIESTDPISALKSKLETTVNSQYFKRVIDASSRGERAVTNALAKSLEEVLKEEEIDE